MKTHIIILVSTFIAILITPSCVAKDPVLDVVINEVKQGMQTDYASEMSQTTRITAFENTLKVYMTDDYPNDGLEKFAGAITSMYGETMRKNKKLSQTYYVSIFQRKMIDNKKQMKQIAECTFQNGADNVEVKLLGLGSGKYDIKD